MKETTQCLDKHTCTYIYTLIATCTTHQIIHRKKANLRVDSASSALLCGCICSPTGARTPSPELAVSGLVRQPLRTGLVHPGGPWVHSSGMALPGELSRSREQCCIPSPDGGIWRACCQLVSLQERANLILPSVFVSFPITQQARLVVSFLL